MANPRLPGISENEQALLYAKLNTTEAGPLSKRREFTWWYYPDQVNPTIRYGFILLYRKNNPSFTYMICHRTSTNPSAWQVLCSIIQGDA